MQILTEGSGAGFEGIAGNLNGFLLEFWLRNFKEISTKKKKPPVFRSFWNHQNLPHISASLHGKMGAF
jgi:hypothetical protein